MTPPSPAAPADPARADALLAWGEAVRRDLPWRHTRDPWAVLVSEVMLQQTQVDRVVPRYGRFLERWPTPADAASAPLGEVLAEWQGLGYPRRARNLWAAAGAVVERHGGALPEDLDDLLALPGVGPYTARAVLVFAFEWDVGVVDTNVGRILARWEGARLTPRAAQVAADAAVPRGHAWAWGQAMFDLGAGVCRPAPLCDACPVQRWCAWSKAGRPEPDPAAGSAGVSTRQARFEGSDRQLRGRLMAALAAGPVAMAEMGAVLDEPDPVRRARIVDGVVSDGLAEFTPDRSHLRHP